LNYNEKVWFITATKITSE